MSEETSPVEAENSSPDNNSQSDNWRARLKDMGRRAFELAEMERLGLWPPDPDAAARTAAAQEELKELQQSLRPLRKQVRALEKEISEAGDIQNPRTGLVMGSGGPSTHTIVEAADITREKGPKRIGPLAVPKAMSSTASATLATPFGIKAKDDVCTFATRDSLETSLLMLAHSGRKPDFTWRVR